MSIGIQQNNYRSVPPSATEIKTHIAPNLTKRINPLGQHPTKKLHSPRPLAESLGTSLFNLGARCFDIAKEILLAKADEFSQWAYQGLKDIPSLHSKTPLEIDYAHDKTFWHAHFCSTLDELSSSPDDMRLQSLQNLVWSGLLSPAQYEKGLDRLNDSSAVRDQFRTTLKNCPIAIESGLREDLRVFLSSHTDLKEILDYYHTLMNPLDYKNVLSAERTFLQKHKRELAWPHSTYQNTIATLNEAIVKSHVETRKALKRERALFNQLAQELPFYFAEIDAKGIWADVKEHVSKTSATDLSTLSNILTRAGKKGIRYIAAHPFHATMMVLATQVTAAAALGALAGPNRQRKSLMTRGTGRTVGNEFRINSYTMAAFQDYPTIASLKDGGFVVAWESYGQDGDGWGVYGKRFAANGKEIALPTSGTRNATGNEFPINTYPMNGFFYPTIASLPDGGFVVTWMSSEQDGTSVYGRGIYGKRFAVNGTEITTPTSGTRNATGNEFPINTYTTNSTFSPTITSLPLPDGGFVVTWESLDQDRDSWGVYGKRFAANGTEIALPTSGTGNALGKEFPVNTYTTNDQQYPTIVSLSDGGFVVTWWSVGQDGSSYGIYGKRFAANGMEIPLPTSGTGNALGNEFPLNTYTPSDQVYPAITSLPDGGFVVTWGSYGQDGDGLGIYGKRFAANGTEIALPTSGTGNALDKEFPVNTYTTSSQDTPTITSLPDGGFVVTWVSSGQGSGVGYGIYSKRFAANGNELALPTSGTGNALGNEFPVTYPISISTHMYPTITSLPDGGFVVTWDNFDGDVYSIYGKRFAANGMEIPLQTPTTTGTTGTTGPITTGTASTTGTTETPVASSPPDTSPSAGLIAGLVLGLGGGAALIAVGTVLGRKYYLMKRASSHNEDTPNLTTELNSRPSSGFEPTQEGILTHPAVVGTLNRTPFALWEQISPEEAAALENILHRKIPFVPDSSNQNEMTFYLGKGQFGEAFLASNITSKELVAVKRVRGEKQIQESLQEGQLQNQLKGSPYIMSLLDYLHFSPSAKNTGKEPYLLQFMPLALINGVAYKTLAASLANEDPTLHKRLLATHTFHLIKGLNFMHTQGIYHSDMKDANILFMPDFTLKIADFGRAMQLGKEGLVKGTRTLGDRRKFAPEQVAYIRHLWKQDDKNADIGPGEVISSYAAGPADLWSGALFILETLAENEPFGESVAPFVTKITEWTNASFQKVIDRQRVFQEASESNLSGVIKELLIADPGKRMDSSKALKWPVFKTLKMLQQQEGADLLKRLMNASTTSQTALSPNSGPYGATSQEDRENHYGYSSKTPSNHPNAYEGNHKDEVPYSYNI